MAGVIDTGAKNPGTVTTALPGDETWEDLNNAKTSDDNCATTVVNPGYDYDSYYLKATNFGFSIPMSSLIKGIKVEIERYGQSTKDKNLKIIKADGNYGDENKADTINYWSSGDPGTYVTYGGTTDLWSETWTATNINNANFGVGLQVRVEDLDGAYVDHIRITIYYVASTIISAEVTLGMECRLVPVLTIPLSCLVEMEADLTGYARRYYIVMDETLTYILREAGGNAMLIDYVDF